MEFKVQNISIHSIDTNRLVEDRSELSIDDKKIKSLATSIYDKGLLQPMIRIHLFILGIFKDSKIKYQYE